MMSAIALAGRGRGRTTPNPSVGCIVVRDGRLIGRGWTQPGGRPHAEARAIEAAGDVAGATLYVTLEPCAHVSTRGPACADLIAAARPARVVIAMRDPDPRTDGTGIARLEAAGVTVTQGVETNAARGALAGFLTRQAKHRPQGTLKLAIFMMDLDRFKYVNDTLGHGVGDHVLREVSLRLEQAVTGAECIARLGGDEFAILLKHSGDTDCAGIARQIIAALEAPFMYEEQQLDVGTSIGIAHYPEHGRDAQTLLRNADIAMYAAKRDKTGYAIYDPHYDTSQQEHLSLLGELRRAVERDELRLYYQPKVSLHSSNISAVEALIRWEHPLRGLVPPGMFIPFAEHTGYIKLLTRWVMREAVRQCGAWLREGLRLQVSVNISARDLMNRDLPTEVSALLAEHAVPPALLCLEITESGFMEDPANAQKVLDRLAELGVRLSIDDYGTGYSSLSYIMRLPVQELKIDQSFISRMAMDEEISTIVRSTIDLGHNLGLEVVAEGVEDRSVWNMLRSLGCDDAQGFFMSKPLAADALAQWIRANDGCLADLTTGRQDLQA